MKYLHPRKRVVLSGNTLKKYFYRLQFQIGEALQLLSIEDGFFSFGT